jgi:hypothetical protein
MALANNNSLAKLIGHVRPDCNGTTYSLQLNMYRHMLEKHYGMVVSEMKLVNMHPDIKTGFSVTDVPRMETETAAVFASL